MVITDFMGKVGIVSRWMLCLTLLILNLGNQLTASEAPPTLVCDDQINVSLGADCNAVITPDLILEGSPTGMFTVLLSGVTGNTILSPGNYTVTVTDGTNSCWGNILAEDKIGPTLSCDCADPAAPCDLPFLCGDLGDGLVKPTVTGECSEVVSSSFSDSFIDLGCGASTLTRTWSYTDTYGNVSTCVSYYQSTVVDVLNDDPLLSNVWCPASEVQLPCGAPTSPEDIYTYTYEICLKGAASPDLLEDEDFIATCVEAAANQAYPYYHEDDGDGEYADDPLIILNGNVCQTFTSYTDITIPICNQGAGCSENNKIIREWKIYDWCQNGSDPRICRQTILASDEEAPVIEVSDFSASVDPWGCTGTIVFPKPTKLIDGCSSFVDYTVTTTTFDLTGGVGAGTGMGTTGSGTGSGSTPVVVSDPALAGVSVTFNPDLGFVAENVPIGTYTFYYNAFDCCGNTTVASVLVTVIDATPPVAITKQDIVVSLIPNPGNTSEPGITKIFAENIDNGSFDGCGDVRLEIRREDPGCNIPSNVTYNNDGHSFDDELDTDEGKFVQFCCQDIIDFGIDENGDGEFDYAQFKVWLRVWDDGDGDGVFGSAGDNFSEVWSWVRLEDKSQPTILCPGNVEVDCTGDLSNMSVMGNATAFNSCGTLGTAHRDIEVNLSNCSSGTVRRQWYVVGNESINCIQTIEKLGSTPTDLNVTFPRDTIIDCAETLEDMRPLWTAGPCDQIAYNVDRDTFYFQEGACFKILNYYTVINWCSYNPDDADSDGIYSDVQVVKIFDESAPVINCPAETVVATTMGSDCSGPVMLTMSATDSGVCAATRLNWEVQVDLYSDWNIDFNYSSRINPTSPFYIQPSGSGEEIKITVPEGDSGEHRVIWKVSDGCGNSTTCTSYFTVADNVPPTPYCVNLSTALMENGTVDLWACDFDLGAFDNCSAQADLRFTFTDVHPDMDPDYNPDALCSAHTFDCDDILNPAGTIVPVNVYVWDTDDNSDFCTVFLTLVDNNGNCPDNSGSRIAISGSVNTEATQSIENVQVELLSNQPSYPLTEMTDENGVFMFDNTIRNQDYELSGAKNDDFLNGVSTLDLVIIQRHILGIETLNSPYKLIAADINNDNLINGIDLVELRKLILGIYTELPQNDSWRFLNESMPMDIVYPWPLNEIRTLLGADNNMMEENFVGVKVGDVNGDVISNLHQNSTSAVSNTGLELGFADVNYVAGDLVEMTLSSKDMMELSGLQFTMNMSGLELVNVRGEELNISESNFATISDDVMTFSWNDTEVVKAENLFTLQFRALESGELSNTVTLSSAITSAEAYSGTNLQIIPVTLTGRNNSGQEFALYQNSPNPFNGATTISFNLPEAGSATISVTDVTGKTIFNTINTFEKGVNTFDINTQGWNASGILYYKVETEEYSATKKMIILE